ncbi:glycoside hydrolase [Massilia sp. WF1]|uniref:glycosyl hydrolase n=1 Tax=unclassified Massilia TaxID=2609279 RepID=UPI000649624F|nr:MULTISPECIES: glycosyl hydrolase [unclassified Massilia]ALK95435.1 glycoside hydrolase [Massilia sp. WG5]KLU34987.1 glycoside hydrolase [Massilia sp. WF1]
MSGHASPLRQIALAAAIACLATPVPAAPGDPLAAGFDNPPQSARPRVWWHWLNGNVTKEGIRRDLDWMARSGLGGLQNFDAEMMTPQVVARRLPYMSPEWDDAFRFAVQQAEQHKLEFGIAASAGWSETGGPWVRPEDGMKKLVWSETIVEGGKPLELKLPAAPRTTGPFQDLFVQPDIMGQRPAADKLARCGADIAVYAYPVDTAPLPLPAIRVAGKDLDAARLAQLGEAAVAEIALPSSDKPAIITLDYASPQTVRSATIFFPGVATLFDGAGVQPMLEASIDGAHWRKVADLPPALVPASAGFAPVTAAHFRVVIAAKPAAPNPAFMPVPGADTGPFGALGQAKGLRLAHLRLSGEPKVNQFETKAGFATADDYYALDTGVDAGEAGVAPSAIVDLSGKVRPDGTLDWTPPNGRWKILRLGWSLTGTENHPATPEATGLEVDKYDGKAVRNYLETYLSKYEHAAGKELVGARGVRALVTDSIEVGASNWTPRLLEQFRRLRGYDARPWLPALAGVIVKDRARSDAFLYDYRRTLAELMASEHYGTVAEVARAHGMRVYGEALESARVTLGDDMAMRSHTDIPMAAMWTYRPEFGPNPTAIADMRGAASVAHLYGQNLVAAESMTSAMAPWAFAPSDLRPMIDMEFASGVNLPVIHTSVHQPLGDDKKPGLSLAIFGQYFNRNETWAGMARPWVDYMARSSYLLQQGRFYADVGYFYGEEAPLVALYKKGPPPDAPRRYAYDFVNADALLHKLAVKDGDVVAASGARYRVLYLGGSSQRMTLAVLRRLQALAGQGATIVGPAPSATPGLADDADAFAALVKRMWSGAPVTAIGKGRVIDGRDVEAALAQLGQAPDVDFGTEVGTPVLFVHRRLRDGDIYFVSNRSDAALNTAAHFNVRGKAAEFWHADTGRGEAASYRSGQAGTVVPLALGAHESVFVVFRRPATAAARTVPLPSWSPAATLDGAWAVSFDGLAAPDPIARGALGSLTQNADPRVKYFSGTTTYRSSFTLPGGARPDAPMQLDLGQVGDVAEVLVNGKPAGIAWKKPYRVEVGQLVKPGANTVEIRVANLWVNRLIGDAQPGAAKVSFTTMPTYTADAPLRPAGLIGPVTLQVQRNSKSER